MMDEYIKPDSIPLEAYLKAKEYVFKNESEFMVSNALNQNIEDKSKLENSPDIRTEIDLRTSAEVLPFHCPIKTWSSIENSLRNFNIYEIKNLLSMGENVKNFIITDDGIKRYRCSSKEKTEKLEILIKLYDEQVDRLFESEKNKGNIITPRLFYKDDDAKRKIVLENLDSIGKNFVKAGSEFVFGIPTNTQLCNILYSTNKERKKIDSLAYSFTTMIANYSTLDELLENPENPSAISRLVKK